ncbi:hypothetical protein [Blastococcus brunescens]|uniref:Uncharacterized protein n=1 Tax=Blastococcus brunescens TaxID=1564165 RepID=A0ABZ1BA55_9ACTN|nr:hypothetical protein [Blastococcus sp. BMG 8361]WRL66379.1 hypothetical protein U6N30_13630 [Blastococcus sp. BMG 8361]
MIHDSALDVSDAREPTAIQADVIDLLELNPAHRPVVRLSLKQWRQVDRVAARLSGHR